MVSVATIPIAILVCSRLKIQHHTNSKCYVTDVEMYCVDIVIALSYFRDSYLTGIREPQSTRAGDLSGGSLLPSTGEA